MVKKVTIYLIIPTFLLVIWLVLSYSAIGNVNGMLESKHHSANSMMLLSGDIFAHSFIAKHDNLGQVGVRFFNHQRISQDQVEFRIKESGSPAWFYRHIYRVDQFLPHELFPFGFPVIPNSKGKSYTIQIESLSGRSDSHISISDYQPTLVSRYQFSKHDVTSSVTEFRYFVWHKIINYLTDIEILATIFIYSLPLTIYTLLLFTEKPFFTSFVQTSLKSSLQKNLHIPINLITLGFLNEILFIPGSGDLIVAAPMTLWAVIVFYVEYPPKISFLLAIFNILLINFFFIIDLPLLASKSSVWAYAFALIGFTQIFTTKIRQRGKVKKPLV